MDTRTAVDRFLAGHRIAVVGVSRRKEDFSRVLFQELAGRGYDVVPVHPSAGKIDGRHAYARVGDVPGALDGALVMTSAKQAAEVVRDCGAAGVPRVWLFRAAGEGAVSPEALRYCRERDIEVVPGECPFMFFGGSVHALHRAARRVAGTFPLCAAERARAARATKRLLAALLALELFVAIGALVGGGSMLAEPDGTPMGLPPPSELAGLGFASYFVPGLVLFVANGILPLAVIGGSLLARPEPGAGRGGAMAHGHALVGAVLVGWIAVQVLMLGWIHFLQPVLLAVGVALLVLGSVYRARTRTRPSRELAHAQAEAATAS